MSLSTPPQTPNKLSYDVPSAPIPDPVSSTPSKPSLFYLSPPLSPPSELPLPPLSLSPPPTKEHSPPHSPPIGLGLALALPRTPLSPSFSVFPLKLSKRHQRLTVLLLSSSLLLVLLSSILLSSASAVLSLPASLFSSPPPAPVALSPRPASRPSRRPPAPALASSALILTPPQELAALIYHLSSLLDANSLPPALDPNRPLDPDLVLGFDTRGPDMHTVQARVEEMVLDTWAQNPVVLFTRQGPRSREVVQLLETYALSPAPLIVDLSTRADSRVLLRLLGRLTTPGHPVGAGEVSLPLLIVGGQAVHATVRNMHEAGELAVLFESAGARVGEGMGGRRGGRGKRWIA